MSGSSLRRVLEPELMDTDDEATAYDAMNHATVNLRFVADFLGISPDITAVLDVGTGTALIPIALVQQAPEASVLAIDLAASMLEVARRNVERAGLDSHIELALVDAKSITAGRDFTSVISNSIIHHIAEPSLAFESMARVLRPGGWLFVRDLVRPSDDAAVSALIATYASTETPTQRALFEASLRAALTVDEVRAIVERLGIPSECVGVTSDRHWTLAYRSPETRAHR
jgi:ubiquinone/menaquinone biosynthesis C-methylase UbiE